MRTRDIKDKLAADRYVYLLRNRIALETFISNWRVPQEAITGGMHDQILADISRYTCRGSIENLVNATANVMLLLHNELGGDEFDVSLVDSCTEFLAEVSETALGEYNIYVQDIPASIERPAFEKAPLSNLLSFAASRLFVAIKAAEQTEERAFELAACLYGLWNAMEVQQGSERDDRKDLTQYIVPSSDAQLSTVMRDFIDSIAGPDLRMSFDTPPPGMRKCEACSTRLGRLVCHPETNDIRDAYARARAAGKDTPH